MSLFNMRKYTEWVRGDFPLKYADFSSAILPPVALAVVETLVIGCPDHVFSVANMASEIRGIFDALKQRCVLSDR